MYVTSVVLGEELLRQELIMKGMKLHQPDFIIPTADLVILSVTFVA